MKTSANNLDRLIVGYLIDDLAPDQLSELQELLRRDPKACRRFVELSEEDLDLRAVLGNAAARRTHGAASRRRMYGLAGLAAAALLGILAIAVLRGSPQARTRPESGGVAREEGPKKSAPAAAPPLEKAPSNEKAKPEEPPVPREREDVKPPPGSAPGPAAAKPPSEGERPDPLPPPREPEGKPNPPGVPPPTPPSPAERKEERRTEAVVALLDRAEGRVVLSRDGVEADAQSGQELVEGLGLKTVGPNSRAVLKFPDGTVVEAASGTTLREFRARGGKRIHLAEGTLEADVAPQAKEAPLVIITPQGEATVLGSSLRIIVDLSDGKNGSTRLEVEKGKVRLKSSADGKWVDVFEGYHAVVATGVSLMSRPSPPTLNLLAARMKPGTWQEFRTRGFGPAVLGADKGEHLLTFSQEAKWDPKDRQVHLVGFARPDTTRHVLYDEKTNAWRPVPLKNPPGGLGHTYDHLAFDPSGRKLYFRGFDSSTVHEYDLANGAWAGLPDLPRGTADIGALEYFPEMQGLVLAGSGDVWLYSLRSRTWKNLATGLELLSAHNWAEYDPVHKVMFLGDGREGRAVYRLNASGQTVKLSDAPADPGETEGAAVVDPSSGRLLLLSRKAEGSFHEYDLQSDRWSRLDAPPAPLLRPLPASVAAAPIAAYGVILFLCTDAESSRVFLYKHGRKGR